MSLGHARDGAIAGAAHGQEFRSHRAEHTHCFAILRGHRVLRYGGCESLRTPAEATGVERDRDTLMVERVHRDFPAPVDFPHDGIGLEFHAVQEDFVEASLT